jgi:hypothetical protein
MSKKLWVNILIGIGMVVIGGIVIGLFCEFITFFVDCFFKYINLIRIM